MEKKIILTVCHGNIHRSVIAAACFNQAIENRGVQDRCICISRGLQGTCGEPMPAEESLRDYPLEWALSDPILSKLRITIPSDQKATPIDPETVAKASVILAMDYGVGVLSSRFNSLQKQFSEHAHKMRLYMELVGQKKDLVDCFGCADPKIHKSVIKRIHKVAQYHSVYFLIEIGCTSWDELDPFGKRFNILHGW